MWQTVKYVPGSAKGLNKKKRENNLVEYLDYQIPATQLKGPK